jgi:thymidylate kinase
MERVAQGYRALAKRFPERIFTVDAALPPDAVAERVRERVKSAFADALG